MEISAQELKCIIADFVQIGFMQAIKAYEPSQDLLRKSEVKKWLKMMMISEAEFKRLLASDHIKPIRMGEGRNSPLFYSKQEIKQALSMMRINNVIVNNMSNFKI